METETIMTMISSVGFPIVMCLLLWYQIQQSDARHREEIDSLREALADLKTAIETLKTAILGGEK